jgi:hypothetical protein
MSKLKVGEMISIKIKFTDGTISEINHNYLITEFLEGNKFKMIDIAQFDSFKTENEYLRYEDYILVVNAEEGTCIKKESYIDLKKEIRIEDYDELVKYKITNPLSKETIKKILTEYRIYKETHVITNDNKTSLLKEVIEEINN